MRLSVKRFIVLIITAAVFAALFFPSFSGAEKTGKVHGGWLILRSDPSYKGNRLSSYPTGTVVTITGQSGKWYAVKTPDGLTGYMLGSYLTVSGDDLIEGQNAWVTSKNGLNVKLRGGPGTKYGALASYPPGTKCTVVSKYGNFTQIKIGTLTGYMMTQYLTGTDPGSGGDILYDVYVISPDGAGVNMRSGPSKGNKSIGFYAYGTKAGLIKEGAAWSLISIDGKVGYMMSVFLSKTEPSPYVLPNGSYVFSRNGKNVNLRSGPGKNYSVIKSFSPGTSVTIMTSGTNWHFVKIGNYYGYMMSMFIITKSE